MQNRVLQWEELRGIAAEKDKEDALKGYKDDFYIKPGQIYLDGNSLGLMSKQAEQALLKTMEEWKELAIEGWSDASTPWFRLSEELGAMSAPLVGATAEEVIVTGSTTINLHQMIATFYKPIGKRKKIIADELNFPSDLYALQSQLRLHGLNPEEHLILVKSRNGRWIEEQDVIAAMQDDVALVVLPSVLYRSGQLLNMALLTEEAHRRGMMIGFDCCHSVGVIPHHFDQWDIDFAYWCNYKYVNSGPGGPASIYVNQKHFGTLPGLAGWFSSDKTKQFDMANTLTPAGNAGAWQIGTPHIFSAAPLKGSLQLFAEAGIERIREKSWNQTAFLMEIVDNFLTPYGFEVGNPREPERRGGHVSLEHAEAVRICKALKQRGVVPDFRMPNVVRLAPIAFYTSYSDIVEACYRLDQIMEKREFEAFEKVRGVIA